MTISGARQRGNCSHRTHYKCEFARSVYWATCWGPGTCEGECPPPVQTRSEKPVLQRCEWVSPGCCDKSPPPSGFKQTNPFSAAVKTEVKRAHPQTQDDVLPQRLNLHTCRVPLTMPGTIVRRYILQWETDSRKGRHGTHAMAHLLVYFPLAMVKSWRRELSGSQCKSAVG